MTKQNLNGTQIRSCFQQMRGEAVPQRVGMNLITESGSLSRRWQAVQVTLGLM